jgi:hypothetical protein
MMFFKKRVVKEIDDGVWGHLVKVHHIDVDTLSNEMRCVKQEGILDGRAPVTFVRVFKPAEVEKRGIAITGWGTFDEHPELILFEGYLKKNNEAYLEPKSI